MIEFCPLQQEPESLLHGNRLQLHWSGDKQKKGERGQTYVLIFLWDFLKIIYLFVCLRDSTVSLKIPHFSSSAWICKKITRGLLNKCKLKTWFLTDIEGGSVMSWWVIHPPRSTGRDGCCSFTCRWKKLIPLNQNVMLIAFLDDKRLEPTPRQWFCFCQFYPGNKER